MSKNQKRKFESPEKEKTSGKGRGQKYPIKKIIIFRDKTLASEENQDEVTDQTGVDLFNNPFKNKILYHSGLAELNLSNTFLNYDLIKILGKFLKTDTSVTHLKLIRSGIGTPGILELAKGIAFNNTIIHLDLSDNGSGCVGTEGLVKALSQNTSLTYLNLARNHINIKGGQSIGDLLASNRSIKEVDLDGNNIGNLGGARLAEALNINTTLGVLRLSGNFITEKGMEDIFISLSFSKGLITLDIASNPLCHEKCKLLASSLEKNQTLTEINMESTYVSSTGAVLIDRAMSKNFTVKYLPLGSSYGITKGLVDSIQEKIDRNVVLQDEVYEFIRGFDIVPRPVMTLDNIRLFKWFGRSSSPALEERLKSADISSEKVFKFLKRYHAEEFLFINLICKGSLSPTKTSFSKLESLPSTMKAMIGEWLGMGFLGDESTELAASTDLSGATEHGIEVFDA